MDPSSTIAKNILLTGCSSGIGRLAAVTLRERGWRVFATVRRERDVAPLREIGFEACRLDLADSDSIREALDWVLDRSGGRLDALFNNGAYGQPGALEDLSREALREQFEVNLFGTHELTRRVIPVMRAAGGGRIIQNSSVLGFVALKYRGAYIASKFALEGWTDTLRLELAGSGIRVILIEPGPIATRFRANGLAAFQRHIDAQGSIHREAYRQEVARLGNETSGTPFTLPPEAVVRRLIHALESPRPRLRYRVTTPTRMFAILKRLLPAAWLDAILVRV
ncbi:MAG: SDR family oxidoreductase [Magnetococcales bacterium]|nr:SDR family oxidoreductase [Magnetococcales bacterium]